MSVTDAIGGLASTVRYRLGLAPVVSTAPSTRNWGWGPAQAAIAACVLLLNLIGLTMVLSASSVTSLYDGTGTWHHFTRQSMWIVIGVGAMIVGRSIDYHRLRRVIPMALVVTFLLMIATALPGVGIEANGSRRWLGTPSIRFQTTEAVKLVMILYVADLLATRLRELGDPKRTVTPIMYVLIGFGVLTMAQPDLGTALIIAGIVFAMLFVGGVALRPLATWAFAGTVVALVLGAIAPYRRARILAFMDPWEDPLNTGYQTIQSLVGIASGGVSGVGVGQGRAKWGYLPFAHTDFIYAVVGEELGFVGALCVLALVVTTAVFGVQIVRRAPDRFGSLLASGIVVWLLLQSFVNIGAVVGVLPITGVPLPFVSFGGTSLVAGMFAVGVLLGVGRQSRT